MMISVRRTSLIWICTVFLAGLIGLLLFTWQLEWVKTMLPDDGVRGGIFNFLMVALFGGLVSFAFANINRTIEKDAARKNWLRSFYSQLVQAYTEAKRIRRNLRACARSVAAVTQLAPISHTGHDGVSQSETEEDAPQFLSKTSLESAGRSEACLNSQMYRELMRELIIVQLDFEELREQAETSQEYLGQSHAAIKKAIDVSADYLSDIISEFEDSYSVFAADPTPAINQLPCLAEFIGKLDETKPFVRNFKAPYHRTRDEILKLLRA